MALMSILLTLLNQTPCWTLEDMKLNSMVVQPRLSLQTLKQIIYTFAHIDDNGHKRLVIKEIIYRCTNG